MNWNSALGMTDNFNTSPQTCFCYTKHQKDLETTCCFRHNDYLLEEDKKYADFSLEYIAKKEDFVVRYALKFDLNETTNKIAVTFHSNDVTENVCIDDLSLSVSMCGHDMATILTKDETVDNNENTLTTTLKRYKSELIPLNLLKTNDNSYVCNLDIQHVFDPRCGYPMKCVRMKNGILLPLGKIVVSLSGNAKNIPPNVKLIEFNLK